MREIVIPTEHEIQLVRGWAKHNNLPQLRRELGKSRAGTYMTIARVYRHERGIENT